VCVCVCVRARDGIIVNRAGRRAHLEEQHVLRGQAAPEGVRLEERVVVQPCRRAHVTSPPCAAGSHVTVIRSHVTSPLCAAGSHVTVIRTHVTSPRRSWFSCHGHENTRHGPAAQLDRGATAALTSHPRGTILWYTLLYRLLYCGIIRLLWYRLLCCCGIIRLLWYRLLCCCGEDGSMHRPRIYSVQEMEERSPQSL
jgi:hypothetical protein